MSGGTVDLAPGTQLWFEGEVWAVQEVTATSVTLLRGQQVRAVATAVVSAQATVLTDEAEPAKDEELVSVLLGNLAPAQVAALEERAGHVRQLLADIDVSGQPAHGRLATKAAELGVSVRTLQRWVSGYRDAGVAGLADSRLLSRYTSSVDQRWDATCLRVLADLVDASTPTMSVVIARVARELDAEHGPGVVPVPSRTTAYSQLRQLSKGRHAFGSAKGRRSVAARPQGVYGRLVAQRPGEYVVLDSTPLDVFAMEPVTLRWVPVELTVALDLYTRCVLGLRLAPVSTTAQDVANVLYQCVTPQEPFPTRQVPGALAGLPLEPPHEDGNEADHAPAGSSLAGGGARREETWPFHGVPSNVLVGSEEPDGVSQARVGGLPACMPEAIVIDHGKAYMSSHVMGVCARLGITVQPAIPHKPTDKPTVERFFRTLRQGLLQHLPAYKGPDVANRGKDIEGQAFFYTTELEAVIRQWVGTVYHHTAHAGLCVPQLPQASFSPAEMLEVGLARAGILRLPARPGLAYDFLAVEWRTIQHYGVEIHGQRYNGPGLNLHRGHRSPFGGVHAGKWPFHVDVSDVRYVHFRDPDTGDWHRLDWEHAHGLDAPFSQAAADYARKVSFRTHRHVDPAQAVHDLLAQWSRGEVTARRDRALARRLSAQRAADYGAAEREGIDAGMSEGSAAEDVASLPGVVDLVARRSQRARGLEVSDDVDVFERYYAEHPDEAAFEVLDE